PLNREPMTIAARRRASNAVSATSLVCASRQRRHHSGGRHLPNRLVHPFGHIQIARAVNRYSLGLVKTCLGAGSIHITTTAGHTGKIAEGVLNGLTLRRTERH